jgi:hypothetical protein
VIGDAIQLQSPKGKRPVSYVFVDCVVRGPKKNRRLRFHFEFVSYEEKTESNKKLATERCDMAPGFVRLSHLLDAGWRIVSP